MRRALLAALLAAPLAVSIPFPPAARAASGVTVTLSPALPPAAYHPAGHDVDILEITPGMSPDKVQTVLQREYGNVQISQDNLGLEDHGVMVATRAYVTRMQAQKGNDQASVWFGTPTTGNAVVEVTHQLIYIGGADGPLLQDVRGGLILKYGKPGFDGAAVGTGEVELLSWSFKGDKPSPCAASSCRADLSEGVDVQNLASYTRAVRTGHDLTIVATLLASTTDPTRAASVVVTMSDAATKMHSLEEAIKQMRAAIGAKPGADKKPALNRRGDDR